MKKILALFMVFSLMTVFTVSAAQTPVFEKQVMVFVLDVGLVTLPVIEKDQLYTIMETVKSEVLYTDSFLFRKIVYESTMINDNADNKKVQVIKIGDTVPITA